MAELDVSPAFESALRAGLAELAATAPVPGSAHLDALERRAVDPPGRAPRNGRPLVLVAAIVVVIAGLVGALALRDRDSEPRFDKVSGEITTTTTATTTTTFGPVLSARPLSTALGGRAPDAPANATLMNAATDAATLAEIWSEAGLPASELPTIDFGTEVVVEVVMDDVGCPSPELEFQKGPAAVRAHAVEPATCSDPLTTPAPRAYFYVLRWADTGRPFSFDVVDPADPDAFGSIPVD